MSLRNPPAGSDAEHPEQLDLALIFDLVRAGGQAVREVSRLLRESGSLPLMDIFTLGELDRADEQGVRTKQLADRLGITTSSLAYRLLSLESAGLITRRRHDGDGRGVDVLITDAGRSEYQRGAQALADVTDGSGGLLGQTPEAAASAAHAVLSGNDSLTGDQVASFAHECLGQVAEAESLDQMFRTLSRRVCELVPVDSTLLYVAVADGLRATSAFNGGSWGNSMLGIVSPFETDVPSAQAFAREEPVLLESRQQIESQYPVMAAMVQRFGFEAGSQFAVPASVGGRPLAVVAGIGLVEFAFTNGALTLLELLARAVALRLDLSRDLGEQAAAGSRRYPRIAGLLPEDNAIVASLIWGLTPFEATGLLGLDHGQATAVVERLTDHFGAESADRLRDAIVALIDASDSPQ